MTSSIKDTLSIFTGGSSKEGQEQSTDKYLLKVTAGTTYKDSTRKSVVVNGKDCVIDERTRVAVRISQYQGLPGESEPESAYFKDSAHTKDTYSIAFSWVPEEDVSAEDLVWGIELVNPIGDRIPKRFITTAFDICKRFVDASLICDPYADQPWLNGAILCGSAMTWRVGSKQKHAAPLKDVLAEGADDDGEAVRSDYGIPADEGKRRKFFSNEDKRKGFSFEGGRCHQFDFHNGYIDWKNYALKLPGFSLSVLKWINDRTHTVRFVMKNRKTGQQYLVVTFRLLFGNELKGALGDGECSPGKVHQKSSISDEEQAVVANDVSKVDRSNADEEDADYHSFENSPSRPSKADQTSARSREEERASEADSENPPPSHEEENQPSPTKADVPTQQKDDYPPQDNIPAGVKFGRADGQPIPPQQSTSKSTRKESTPDPTQQNDRMEDTKAGLAPSQTTVNGYRDTIEESLCNTFSVDGRDKPTNVLGQIGDAG